MNARHSSYISSSLVHRSTCASCRRSRAYSTVRRVCGRACRPWTSIDVELNCVDVGPMRRVSAVDRTVCRRARHALSMVRAFAQSMSNVDVDRTRSRVTFVFETCCAACHRSTANDDRCLSTLNVECGRLPNVDCVPCRS
jgi:hypothetical protein